MQNISILNMHEHTEQEVFDFVVNHLLTQGAMAFDDKWMICRYKSSDGKKCAAGCLIPDGEYSATLEGNTWSYLVSEGDMPGAHSNLIMSLQHVHDNIDAASWPVELRKLAKDFGLQFNYNASETR